MKNLNLIIIGFKDLIKLYLVEDNILWMDHRSNHLDKYKLDYGL